MKVLVKKMSNLGLLAVQLIVGVLLMLAVIIALPVSILAQDATLMENPYVLGFVIITMVIFALIAFFLFIRPYIVYRKTPETLAETDGEFLYIHADKEAKIPFASLSSATVRVELPFLYQKDFIREIVIHLFSEQYGDLVVEIPDYGTYKLRFVPRVQETADEFIAFIYQAINSPENAGETAE